MGGDRAFVSELIDQFLTDAPALVETARAGVASGDAGEVRRALHTLTSNAATFGATDLAVSSRQLEELAKGGSLDGVALRLDGIADQLERVSEALAASRFHARRRERVLLLLLEVLLQTEVRKDERRQERRDPDDRPWPRPTSRCHRS